MHHFHTKKVLKVSQIFNFKLWFQVFLQIMNDLNTISRIGTESIPLSTTLYLDQSPSASSSPFFDLDCPIAL